MRIQKQWISKPGAAGVNALMTLDAARVLAEGLELREQRRNGGSRQQARERVARRVGIAPGTLYNLARDRLKKLDADLRHQLAAYAIRDLQHEIASLTSQLESARSLGRSEDPRLVRAIEETLSSAQKLHEAMHGGCQ